MADLPATKLHRHNKIAHKQEAEYWIKIQYVLLTLRMDKLNNNLEFCCSTLHQIVLVDQNSLFGIFSGGLSSCYHFCIWTALLAYLTHSSHHRCLAKTFFDPSTIHVFYISCKRFVYQFASLVPSTDRQIEGKYNKKNTYLR